MYIANGFAEEIIRHHYGKSVTSMVEHIISYNLSLTDNNDIVLLYRPTFRINSI